MFVCRRGSKMNLKANKTMYDIQLYGFTALAFILAIASVLLPVTRAQHFVYKH